MKFKELIVLLILFIKSAIINAQINQYHNDGTRHGLWQKKFDKTDQIRYTGKFDHGVEVGTFKFYKKGFKRFPTAIKKFSDNGKKAEVIFFSQRGDTISKGIEVNRKKEGEWKYFHNRSSKIMMLENYVNGLVEGERVSYYDNGVVSEKLNFLNGKKHGKQLVYSVKGVLIKEFTYENDLLNGINKYYTGRGILAIEGMYKNDKKTGSWKYYDNAGNFIREKYYR